MSIAGFARAQVRKIILTATVLAVASFALSMAISTNVSAAESHGTWVRGFVYDNKANIVPGAVVTVTIDGNPHSYTTDSVGFYNTVFADSEWTVGHDIDIVAIKDTLQTTWSNVTIDSQFQWNNFTFPYEIPEHGSPLGLAVAGVFVGIVAVVALTYSRKH